MGSKRPCSVCRRWFTKNPRAKQQRTCGVECRRELHRRKCAAWRARHPDFDRENRLRDRVVKQKTADAAAETPPAAKTPPAIDPPPAADPLPRVLWPIARDAVGWKVAVVVEESAKVIVEWARDAVLSRSVSGSASSAKVIPSPPRDAVEARGPPL